MENTNFILQYGDIVRIISPTNNSLNEKIFFIKFIDLTKIILLNDDLTTTLDIDDENGKLMDDTIDNIVLLYREESPSFVIQNNITIGKNISITFGGALPKIINGVITNTEEDMIEISILPVSDPPNIIYIDFAYSGIPEKYNIEKIVVKDMNDILSSETPEMPNGEDEPSQFLNLDNNDDLDYDLNNPIDDREFNEILLDDFELEEDYEEFYHNVNVPDNEKRYTLDTQLNDYMDARLNKYKPSERNEALIADVNLELNRYKELRELYSVFDDNNNPRLPATKGEFYKPLKETLYNLNKKLYWLVPVVYNAKSLIYNEETEDVEDIDEEHTNTLKMGEFIHQINSVINKWSKTSTKEQLNDYKTYINNLLSIIDNTTNIHLPGANDDSITRNKLDVNTQMHAISDIYDDFYSFVVKDRSIDKNRFSVEVYNQGMKMLQSDYVNNKRAYNFKDLTPNEKITVISFITLPLPVFNFSKINLGYTSIYTRSNLNTDFFNYYQTLNNDTVINKNILEEPHTEKFVNTHDTIHGNKLFDNINSFSIEDTNNKTAEEKLNLLMESFIPTNSSAIKYLSDANKYVNFKALILDTQALNIDMYSLNNKDHQLINKLFNENIADYKKEYNTNKDLLGELINIVNREPKKIKSKYNFDFDIINKDLKQALYDTYAIDPKLYNDKSELLNDFIEIDSGKFFTATLNKTIMDLIVSNLLDNFITQANKSKEPIPTEDNDDTCEKYYLSKKYTLMEDMMDDNNKELFVDAIYDNTLYSLVNEYPNEKATMDTNTFFLFLTEKIMDIMNLTKQNALREAKAIVEEKREVIDGDYAIFLDNETKKNYIYVRTNSAWVLDEKFKNDFHIDSNKILCDVNKDCISIGDKCMNGDKLDRKNMKDDVEKILDSFQAKYNLSIEEIKGKLNLNYENAKNYLLNVNKIKNEKDRYINNIIRSNYVELSYDIVESPYMGLKDKVLGIPDFIKRQEYIKKFCLKFTRDAIRDENVYWLYCNATGVKLMPTFLLKLANAFTSKQNYIRALDTICAEQGTISDDNNNWVDKHSGYIIKNIDFSSDEGYDEAGFKLNTNAVMGNEYNIKFDETNAPKDKTYEDTVKGMITRVIHKMSDEMEINIEPQHEFIINTVITKLKEMKTKEEYEKALLKAAKKDGKSKKVTSYEDAFNQALVYYTLSYLIVSIQINIPSVSTRKTFPGCVRSFSGYPIDGDQDKTTVVYIACVAKKAAENIKPWNTIMKLSADKIAKNLEAEIDKHVLKNSAVIDLIAAKKEYLLLNKDEPIPEAVSVGKWHQFLPPLNDIKISKTNSMPLGETFENDLTDAYKKGKKNNMLETLLGKNIYLSNSIIESIQAVVNTKEALLTNSAGEPFLESACCDESINAIEYFMGKDKTIAENNNLIKNYNNVIEKINNLNSPSILYHAENTKIILPKIKSGYNDQTIYKAFIYYCNFNNQLPIDDELKNVCAYKPVDYDGTKDTADIIELLKQDGKIYTKAMLDDLLQIINKRNIVIVDANYPIINNVEKLRNVVKKYNTADSVDDNLFQKLETLLDTFDIKKEDTEELDDIKNYLSRANNIMKKNVMEFVRKSPDINKSFRDNMEKILNFEINTNTSEFYENYLYNLLNIFPNIILNKNMNVKKIPAHWLLSEVHSTDIVNILDKYYKNLNSFSNKPGLELAFKLIKNKYAIFLKLIKIIKYNSPVKVSNGTDDSEIPSIFDKEFITYIYSYFFYSIINEYIQITKDDEFKSQIQETHDYDEDEVNKNIINYIFEFLNIMNNHSTLISNSYAKIKDKILQTKAKEKNSITDHLKDLTDEEREVNNLFKSGKLGEWGVGLQKGVTKYVKENYDVERLKMEATAMKERKLNQTDNVTDMNKEIYKLDLEEEEQTSAEIDAEEYNMNNIPDDDDFNSDEEDDY